ncbi:MAG TPA: DUF1570 domain-containing protein [Tepidisphaeraceae bacterium]
MKRLSAAAAVLTLFFTLAFPPGSARAGLPANMKSYKTPYYVMYTDIEPDDAREAFIRMTKMAEEYHERTKSFSGIIKQRLPFYLFKNANDYYAADGPPGSAGVFTGKELMAITGEKSGLMTWHVVQHEGFHQFAHAVIGDTNMPIWVNEGLAEYFGESIFTGDGFVTGVIPPDRLARVRKEIDAHAVKSIKGMMLLSHEEWNGALSIINYDQAWSMVQFLAHGEEGKYQAAFSNFMKLISANKPWQKAWQESFGDAAGFEQKWREYLGKLDENPTRELYVRATTATLTSYLARAVAQKQTFDSFDEFLTAADAGNLKMNSEDWLPPSLLKNAVAQAKHSKSVTFTLEAEAKKPPTLVATMEDKTRLVGAFTLRAGRIGAVGVDVDPMGKFIEQARQLIKDSKSAEARALLNKSLSQHPKSPLAADAKKLLSEAK